jgi:hypothetical protein
VSRKEPEPRAAAKRIEAELERLARIADLSSTPRAGQAETPWRDFPGFWQKAKEISDLFRSFNLDHEDRTRLWKQHQDLCERVSKLRARERQIRQQTSKASKDKVISILTEASQAVSIARSSRGLSQVRSMLDRALSVIKQSFFLRHDRHECWNAWHESDRAPCRPHAAVFAGPQEAPNHSGSEP